MLKSEAPLAMESLEKFFDFSKVPSHYFAKVDGDVFIIVIKGF